MLKWQPIDGAPYRYDYAEIFRAIAAGKRPSTPTYRELAKTDLFFLLYFGLERADVNKPFIISAIREVEDGPRTDTMDLWAREHYKSTTITLGENLQDVIKDPEERIAIFSHTRPIAKGFLREIKQTLEGGAPIKKWFPEIFWLKPKVQAPKWSEDDGLVVKRKSVAKEATFEAWGLVDGQPTSKHFTKRVYDDVVTRESVTTPEMIKKTVDAYELSQSLGTDGGRKRVVGTHYHFADLYMHLRKRGGLTPRIKPATHTGKPEGTPVLLSQERLAELLREQGPYIFACQQLLNPTAAGENKFKMEWIKRFDRPPHRINRYLLCDPANEKKKDSDFTVMTVIGIDADKNRFWLDGIRARLNLAQRWEALKKLHAKWKPQRVGYEKYGKDSDIQHYEQQMRSELYYFPITALGGNTAKTDRIERLVPLFSDGKFWLPSVIPTLDPITARPENLVQIFIDEEFLTFPYAAHDDLLDCMARIEDEDMHATAPLALVNDHRDMAETQYAVLG